MSLLIKILFVLFEVSFLICLLGIKDLFVFVLVFVFKYSSNLAIFSS